MKPRAIRNERTVRNISETVKGTRSMRPVMGIYKLNILGWRLPNRVTISSRSTSKSYLICIRAREESLLSPIVHIAITQRAPTQQFMYIQFRTFTVYPVFLAMLIRNLSYDCNKVSSFLNFFRVFRYLKAFLSIFTKSL